MIDVKLTISEFFNEFPYAEDFFKDNFIPYEENLDKTIEFVLANIDEDLIEDKAINTESFLVQLEEYIEMMKSFFVEEVVANEIKIGRRTKRRLFAQHGAQRTAHAAPP